MFTTVRTKNVALPALKVDHSRAPGLIVTKYNWFCELPANDYITEQSPFIIIIYLCCCPVNFRLDPTGQRLW